MATPAEQELARELARAIRANRPSITRQGNQLVFRVGGVAISYTLGQAVEQRAQTTRSR